MAYRHNVQLHRRQIRSRRFLRFALVIVTVITVAVLYVFFDWLRNNLKDSTVVSQGSEATVQSASINIFRTPYFQFQTDKTWREVTESNPEAKRFVYRSFDGMLVQHELIIEIDSTKPIVLANTQTTRVLPIEIVNNTMRTVGEISPHCKEIIDNDADREQQVITYKDTMFACNPDGSTFIVVAGLVNGSDAIEKRMPNGVIRTYNITYRDSTFSPNGRPLDNIINTFQLL